MRLKSLVDRQDKIEFLNFRQTEKKSKKCQDKIELFSCRTISKITEFVGRTDKHILLRNIYLVR